MTGNTARADGMERCAVRPSWFRRLRTVCLLGAGAYACISLGAQAAAQTGEPATTPVLSTAVTTEQPPAAVVPPPDPAVASSRSQPATAPATTPGTWLTVHPPTTSQDAGSALLSDETALLSDETALLYDETGAATPPVPDGSDAAQPSGGAAIPGTDPSSSGQLPGADAESRLTAATTTDGDDDNGADSGTPSTCGTAIGEPAGTCDVSVPSSAQAVEPVVTPDVASPVAPAADMSCAGSPAIASATAVTATATATDMIEIASDVTDATASGGDPLAATLRSDQADDHIRMSATVPAQPGVGAVPPGGGHPALEAPTTPPQPVAPATAVTGPTGCSSSSAVPQANRGHAPAVAALLSGHSELSLAVTGAARTAPAEGSLATAPNDPSTRPD